MTTATIRPPADPEHQPPRAVWLGAARDAEFASVQAAIAGVVELVGGESLAAAEAATGSGPDFVIFAADRPGRWTAAAAAAVLRRWPLAAAVSVATSLGDGRRRSGLLLAGVEEVAWYELPARLFAWAEDLRAGRCGALGIPATARREERLLDALDALAATPPARRLPVTLAGRPGADLDGLADLLELAGRRVAAVARGRPPLDLPTRLLVWDAVAMNAEDLAWLRMLAAHRPEVGSVILESFPRGDAALAAVRAGAAAVLGRPVLVESLEGTLRRLEAVADFPGATGLGGPDGRR